MSNTSLILIAILVIGLVVALFVIARLKRQPRVARQNLIIPDVPTPSPGTTSMEVHATSRIASGKTIRVRVESEGSPVESATVELVLSMGQTIEATGTTDASGRVGFTAPSVTVPTAFEIRATKPGYSVFIPPEDERARVFQRGYYPLTETIVWPHAPVPGPPTNSSKLWIDVGFGWTAIFGGSADMSPLEAAANTAGWDFDEDWWGSKGTLCDHLDELGPDDMWAFSGHAYFAQGNRNNATAIAPWRKGASLRGYDRMTTQEICDCFGQNGGPGIGFIDACSSHSLLQDLVDCCMKVAVGWSGPVPGTTSSGAMRNFFTRLMNGGTLAQAKAEADRTISGGLNPSTSRIVIRTKAWLGNAGGMTLEELVAAVQPED